MIFIETLQGRVRGKAVQNQLIRYIQSGGTTMKRLGMLLVAVTVLAAIWAFTLHTARAQTLPQVRGGSVEARIAALEQKVSVLESQNAELRSVIQISTTAGSMTISPRGQLVLKGMSVLLDSASRAEIRSAGSAEIKAAGDIIMKGALINLN
jgi:hypothetical protein